MHRTLTPAGNVLLASLWAVFAAVLVIVFPEIWPAAVVGLPFGLIVGVLQGRAIDARPEAFMAATDAGQVRKALLSTPSGKAAIVIQWCAVAVMRELASLPSVRRLARRAEQEPHA